MKRESAREREKAVMESTVTKSSPCIRPTVSTDGVHLTSKIVQ